MKKLLKCLAIIMLLLNSVSISFFAEEDDTVYTEDDVQYRIEDNSAVIIKYNGDDEDVQLPFSFGIYEVRGIKTGAFSGTNVKNITMYDNMTMNGIEQGAFDDGVVIYFINASGEDKGHYTTGDSTSGEQQHSDNQSEVVLSNEEGEIIIEDIDADITSDIEEEDEKPSRPLRIGRFNNYFSEMFDGSNFASNFQSNPIGYVIIVVSVCAIIFIIFKFIIKK